MVQVIVEHLDVILQTVVEFAILFLEFVGVGIVVVTGVNGLIHYIRKDPRTKLLIAEGLSMGLEFKLGGEILRTVIVRDMTSILIVGGIIVLRVALTLLLHWEITNEKKHEGPEEVGNPEENEP